MRNFGKKQLKTLKITLIAGLLATGHYVLPASANTTLKSEIARYMNEGINYHSNRNYLLAIKSFKKALELDRNNSDVLENLSIAHNNYGKYLAERTDGRGAAREFRNSLYYNIKNDVARANLEYKLKENEIDTKDSVQRVLEAKKERVAENFIAAIAELVEANAIKESVEAYLEIGANYHLLALKDPQNSTYIPSSLAALEKAHKLDLEDTRPLIKLGDVNVSIGKVNQGIDYYEQAIKLDPEDKQAQSALINGWLAALRIAPHLANNHVGLATAYQLKGDFSQAERSFRRALQIDPNNVLASNGIKNLKHDQLKAQVGMFLDRALKLQNDGKYDESLSFYIKALNLEPNNPDIHYNIGTAFQAKEDFVRAKKAYNRAYELDPSHMEAKGALGVVDVAQKERHIADAFQTAVKLQEAEKYKDAIAIYNKISVDRPKDDTLFYNLAVAYQAIGDFDNSIETYQKAYDIKPEESYKAAIRSVEIAKANRLLGLAIQQQSAANNKEAIHNYETVVELVPNNANAWYNLGTAYQAIGDDLKALNAYQKAFDIDPNNQTEAMFFAALILEDQRKLIDAIDLYDKYLSTAPAGDYASEAKERQDYIKSFL